MSETDATKIWRKRVAQWRASGRTADDFSEGQGFAPNTLKHWVALGP